MPTTTFHRCKVECAISHYIAAVHKSMNSPFPNKNTPLRAASVITTVGMVRFFAMILLSFLEDVERLSQSPKFVGPRRVLSPG
jgi:hypothetical protein